ncbi:PREDICTED: uncharacterized protein LOC100641456 [Amphimedon queenslandica]|uniref:CARD domain-containing protein n=1 Tax=Amphimedon queenslandica TaxID=400682 RepID=A0A1X7VPH9_AMPQE|nr:PREDICTED: uncharacterized protein LOC100641456 [Amphimedon queenslandica]|eukprot:XP_003383622.2 PREDICTED: uncharacterized protein LOC100641456 [Amphimedon queenslandica]
MAESTIVRNDSGIANEVLRRNVPLVVDSCHPNCVQLADKLYSKRIIPDETWRKAKDTMTGHTIDQRISDMISVVRDSIRTDGSMFRTFTDILRTEDTLPHNKLADVLDKEYDCLVEEGVSYDSTTGETITELAVSKETSAIEPQNSIVINVPDSYRIMELKEELEELKSDLKAELKKIGNIFEDIDLDEVEEGVKEIGNELAEKALKWMDTKLDSLFS